MKKNNPILLVMLTLMTTALSAQWLSTDGPYGRVHIYDIERTDSLLFASTYSGVFVKKDGDVRWEKLTSEFTPKMFLNGDSLYSSFYHGRAIIQTTDPNLNVINFPYGSVPFINGPSFAFLDSLMYISSSEGVFVSADAGASAWQFLTGLDIDTTVYGSNVYYNLHVFDIVATDSNLYCSTTKGVYSSDNTLTSWVKKNSGLKNITIRNVYSGNSGLYGISTDTLYISTDDGNSWSSIFGGGVGLGGVCEANGSIYLAADTMGVLVSSDGGNQWQPFNNGIVNKQVNLVKYVDGELYCATPDDGLYHWSGVQWVKEPTEGMIVTIMRSWARTSAEVYSLDVNKGVFQYQSNNTWQNVSPTISGFKYFNDLLETDDTLYSLVTEYDIQNNTDSFNIYFTSDNGSTWQSFKGPEFPYGLNQGLLRYYNGVFYVFDRNHIFRSFNKGNSWEDITPPRGPCNFVSDLAYFNGDLYLAGCHMNRISKYNESGGVWVQEPELFFAGNEADAFFQRDTFLFVNAYYGLYRRSANVTQWTDLTNGTSGPVYTSDYLNVGDNLFVVSANGIMYTNDFGVTWNSMSDSVVGDYGCVDVDVFNDTLFLAVYSSGVYKHALPLGSMSLPGITKVDDAINLFPNPASNCITISLEDEKEGDYKLMDQSGKVLLDGSFTSGEKLRLPGLTDGLYLMSINSGDKIYCRNLIIRK